MKSRKIKQPAREGKVTSEPRIDADALARYGRGRTLMPLQFYLALDEFGAPSGKLPGRKGWRERNFNSANVIHNCALDNINVGWRLTQTDLVLDVDPRNDGLTSYARLCHDAPFDPSKYVRVDSGRGDGGFHLYMTKDANALTRETLPEYPGLEFKTFGRQVVCAGSLHHKTRKNYTFAKDGPQIEDGIARAPRLLMKMLHREPIIPGANGDGGQMDRDAAEMLLDKLDPADVVPDNKAFERFAPAAKKACADAGAEAYVLEWLARDTSQKSPTARWNSYSNNKAGGIGVGTFITILREHGVSEAAIASVFQVAAKDDFPDDDGFDMFEDDNHEVSIVGDDTTEFEVRD